MCEARFLHQYASLFQPLLQFTRERSRNLVTAAAERELVRLAVVVCVSAGDMSYCGSRLTPAGCAQLCSVFLKRFPILFSRIGHSDLTPFLAFPRLLVGQRGQQTLSVGKWRRVAALHVDTV